MADDITITADDMLAAGNPNARPETGAAESADGTQSHDTAEDMLARGNPEAQDWAGGGMPQSPGAIARIGSAFVKPLLDVQREPMGGIPADTEAYMKAHGLSDDVQGWRRDMISTAIDGVFRPVSQEWDLINRLLSAPFEAVGAAVAQTGREVSSIGGPVAEQAGGMVTELAEGAGEAFPAFGEETGGLHGPHLPHEVPAPRERAEPPPLRAVEGAGITGTEEQWKGIAPLTEEQGIAQAETLQAQRDAQPLPAPADSGVPDLPPAPDIHAVARQIAPEAMRQYDALVARQDTYRRWMEDLTANRDRQNEATAARGTEIDEQVNQLSAQIDGAVSEHKIADLRKQIADLTEERKSLPEEPTLGDTGDMIKVRAALQKNDYAMLDLAPAVREAYREAQERMPPEPMPEQVAAALPAVQEQESAAGPEQPGVVPVAAVAAEGDLGNIQESVAEVGRHIEKLGSGKPPETGLVRAMVDHEGSIHYGNVGESITDLQKRVYAENPKLDANLLNVRTPEIGFANAEGRFLTSGEAKEFENDTSAKPPKSRTKQAAAITDDVTKQLVAAGRPADEAALAGTLVAAHYQARAEAWDGAKGTAEELYRAEFPQVKLGRAAKAPLVKELAQSPKELEQAAKGKVRFVDDARPILTLMKDADASTFVHEISHVWLEEMLRDAEEERAPPAIKADVATLDRWWGRKESQPVKRAQHEKFARGFERYLMEGRAPTGALEKVFAKFKDWLTQIYQVVDKLKAPISDDIRDVFDRLIAGKEARPRAAAPGMFDRAEALAGIHETDAETTPAEHAEEAADRVETETREVFGGKTAEEPGPGAGAPEGDRGEPASEQTPPVALRPGLDHAAPESAVAPSGKPGVIPKGLRRPVPHEPMRLTKFINSQGGIRAVEEAGELRGIHPGLLRADGVPIERAIEQAWENGYFPELRDRLPTVREFLTKLEDDTKGRAAYSERDRETVDRYQEVVAHNSELQRMLDTAGIDPRGMSISQVWDALANHQSLEETARIAEEQAAKFDESFAEAERAAQEAIESRGDAWEPEEVYGKVETRTLEDLENERLKEQTAAWPSESLGRPGEPGPTPAGASTVSDGGGPSGRGAESTGRGAASGNVRRSAGEGSGAVAGAGRDPAIATFDTEPAVTDKAGNIRLENLDTTEDAKAIIRGLVRDNMDLNDARYGDASYRLYHEIKASGQLLVQTSEAAAKAYAKWSASGSDADSLAYVRATQQALIAANIRAEITAGWGRAGHAFQKVDRIAKAQSVVDFIKQTTGKTLFQLKEEGALMDKLDTPEQRAKFLEDSRLTRWQKTRGMILSYFINNLISGPITHTSYMVGNQVWASFKALAITPTAATIGAVREMAAREKIPRVYYGEVGAQLHGMFAGWGDGLVAAGRAVRTGVPYMKGMEELTERGNTQGTFSGMPPLGEEGLRQQQIPGKVGYVLETPSRVVSGIHTIFYSMNYAAEIARRAYRTAVSEGLEGSAFDKRVAELKIQPPTEDVLGAHDEAMQMVLMRRPVFDSTMGHLSRFVNSNIFTKMAMPFLQIGTNLLHEGYMELTPIGVAEKAIRDNIRGRNGPVARDTQYAKIAVGTGVAVTTFALASQGIITGGGPSNFNELRMLESTGWRPYSIKIGGTWVPYRKFLGPLGPLVGGVANMQEIAHLASDDQWTKAASAAIFGFSEVVADETWFSGMSKFVDAARHWDGAQGQRYLRDIGADFIPFSVGMAQVARLIDPYQREIHSLTDAVKMHTPFWSETLHPVNDVWGNPVRAHMQTGISADRPDPVSQECLRVGFAPARMERRITGVPLTPQQYEDYTRIGGRLMRVGIESMMKQPFYAKLPDAARKDIMQSIMRDSRQQAAAKVKIESRGTDNDIVAIALKNHTDKATARLPARE